MKSFTLIILVVLVTANDKVVIPEKMKKILNEIPEIKESIIAKKFQGKVMELERVLEIDQVLDENDSIKDSIQFIKVAQTTYNTSSTNYTQPNITYNYTYTNYSQPTSSYVYNNQSNNISNMSNYTNSTYPNNQYYNTSYPILNTTVNNYVTYDNQSSTNNTNSTNITCSVGYYLTSDLNCQPCLANCAMCTSSYDCISCYYGYSLFTTGCYVSQNNAQNSTSNSSDIYDNSTIIDTNSTQYDYNNTSYNTTYDNSTYYNSTSDNNTYNNSTSDNNTYYNSTSDNNTYQNQTYYNYTDHSRIRQRFNQSRVHLKLRNNFNRFDNNNFTQIISYYNQSNQSQNTVVLFNSSAVVQKQSFNEYYLYQNNSLVVMNQEFDSYGNIVYRSINYDFTIVVSKQQSNKNYQKNQEIYGTIVYGYGNVNATYNNQNFESGYGYQNESQGSFNNSKQATGQFNYDKNYNQAYATFNNQSQGQSQSYQSDSFYNDTTQKNNYSNTNNQYNNYYSYQGQAYFDQNYSTQDSSYSNSDSSYQSNDDYMKVNGLGYENYNTQASTSSSSGSSYKGNYQGDKSQYQSTYSQSNYNSSQDNIVYAENYTLVNQSQVGYNSDYISSNQQNDWQNSTSYGYSNGYKSQDSTFINNQTNSYNVTDTNQYTSESKYQQQQQQQFGIDSSNGYNNFASGQAHTVQITNENITTTDVNATINQYNSSNWNYNGQPQFDGSSSTKDINLTVTDNQQYFSQLRGSKKLATGSWKEVNQKEFASSNGQIVEEARQAITKKFNPEQEGFQFDSISNIQEQIVAGINYNIKLRYLNADSKSIIYEVVLYTIPWANQPNQIISCSRFDQSEI